jgi:hypothetical protein
MEGWRWLFALEGLITGLIGIASYFYLPPSPTQTASRFRGKNGWFTEREEKIMVNRIIRDDAGKGTMHNRQAIDFKMFWECVTDYHMYPIYLIGLTWLIPNNPMTAYLTLQIKSLGFDTFQTNLLTVSLPLSCSPLFNNTTSVLMRPTIMTIILTHGTRSQLMFSSFSNSSFGPGYPRRLTNAFSSPWSLNSGLFLFSLPLKSPQKHFRPGQNMPSSPSWSVTRIFTPSLLPSPLVTLAQFARAPWRRQCTTCACRPVTS